MKSKVYRLNRHSIVHKLLVAFLLVVLPLYILGISITFYSSKQMQAEVERANESKLQFYYSHLEFELQRITRLVEEYSVDDTLASFSARLPIMSQYEVDSNLNTIAVKLKQIRETSPYIGDVVYYLPEINKRVSVQDGVRNVEQQDWQSLGDTMGNLGGPVSVYNNELYVLRRSPFNMDSKVLPNFLLGIKLSNPELELRLKEYAVSGGSDITLVFGSHDEYVLSTAEAVPELLPAPDSPPEEETVSVQRYRQNDSFNYSLYDHSNHFRLTASIPNSILLKPIRVFTGLLWLLTLLSLIIILLFSVWLFRAIQRPISILIRGFEKAEQGQTGLHITHSRKDEFGYLYIRFNDMLRRLHILIEENYVQRIRTGEAELKHLQSQITPHFLYNSLFSIKQMAEVENVELIKEFSDYLGQYFRYMTRDFAQEVTLGQELDHALVYLSIQGIRFGPRIRAEVDSLEPDCRGIKVPRVLLQPILENVFEHGLHRRSSGGLLSLSYKKTGETLVISIEDNGDTLTDEGLLRLQQQLTRQEIIREEETTGLLNVHQRLRIKFGSAYGLQVERSPLGGLCVKVNIPRKGEVLSGAADDDR
ncbi:histidine kinase [Paenibacillus sp. MMS20-IR301]|uniref:sensor histidine kinase n=1 Tax=Paenibacillus sp. MMS20-IR301 TaxID=2895946 RepID=UPI0028EB0C69|nr:histidine kinase [Paenibacillus sp. MMS20-IR301]WNS43633.1 histidine kinase [Paenibacillus sp. MMS20-IR301]